MLIIEAVRDTAIKAGGLQLPLEGFSMIKIKQHSMGNFDEIKLGQEV